MAEKKQKPTVKPKRQKTQSDPEIDELPTIDNLDGIDVEQEPDPRFKEVETIEHQVNVVPEDIVDGPTGPPPQTPPPKEYPSLSSTDIIVEFDRRIKAFEAGLKALKSTILKDSRYSHQRFLQFEQKLVLLDRRSNLLQESDEKVSQTVDTFRTELALVKSVALKQKDDLIPKLALRTGRIEKKQVIEEQKQKERIVQVSSWASGVLSVLFLFFIACFILMIMGYSEADNKGTCQEIGRNLALKIIEQSEPYQIGCELGKRLDK